MGVQVSAIGPAAAPERLYEVFSRYSHPGRDFCDFCYTRDEWNEITRTPVRMLGVELGRKLLWETADHWESPDVYRHYLPRLLEVLGAPWMLEDLYPSHLFETLIALGFHEWSSVEKDAVIEYLAALRSEVAGLVDDNDRSDWAACLAALENPARRLPAPRGPGDQRQ
jgi:hypothetical protein